MAYLKGEWLQAGKGILLHPGTTRGRNNQSPHTPPIRWGRGGFFCEFRVRATVTLSGDASRKNARSYSKGGYLPAQNSGYTVTVGSSRKVLLDAPSPPGPGAAEEFQNRNPITSSYRVLDRTVPLSPQINICDVPLPSPRQKCNISRCMS